MQRRQLLAVTGGLIATSGCLTRIGDSSDSADESDDFDIGMSQNAFVPEEYVTSVGSVVRWKNNGSRAHTVTAYAGGIPSDAAFFATGDFTDELTARSDWHESGAGNIYTGERYEVEFTVPGEYLYFCIPHEPRGMIGQVTVEEE